MIFVDLELKGAFIIDIEKHADERGFFARTWDDETMSRRRLADRILQCSVSFNAREGTLRGMHYQADPHAEAKVVRCTRGAIFDVIIDLRPGSDTYTQWAAVELTADNRRSLYVPEGFAHGFQTLSTDSEVFYQISQRYSPESQRGVRWDDPAFGIEWPEVSERTMSDRDRAWPDFGG